MRRKACPSCRTKGQDRKGDNLVLYQDGGAHCFACGYTEKARFNPRFTKEPPKPIRDTVLPYDFTKEVPKEGWEWLKQWGISPLYWKEHCGYSPREHRLIFPYGKDPIRYAQGRALCSGIKWSSYGQRPLEYEPVGAGLLDKVVLVEDIISAHKVGFVAKAVPLFGTKLYPGVLRLLKQLGLPVVVWLDGDQWGFDLAGLINTLQLQGLEVSVVHTKEDPKRISVTKIKELLE